MKAICSPTIKTISWNKCNSSFHSGFQCCTASGLQCGCAHRKVRFFTHSPLYFPSPIAVWRLSAASPCENFAQHCDGAGGRRLDGTGRVSGKEWPLSRWVQRLTLRSHNPILFKGQLLYWLSLSLFAYDERIWHTADLFTNVLIVYHCFLLPTHGGWWWSWLRLLCIQWC